MNIAVLQGYKWVFKHMAYVNLTYLVNHHILIEKVISVGFSDIHS